MGARLLRWGGGGEGQAAQVRGDRGQAAQVRRWGGGRSHSSQNALGGPGPGLSSSEKEND